MATLSTTVYGSVLAANSYLTITDTGTIQSPGLLAKSASTIVSSGSIAGATGANGSIGGNHNGQSGGIAASLASGSNLTNIDGRL